MNPQITNDGVQIQTFEEVFNELAAGYKEIYGQDINLEQDSPDGQRIGIEAKGRHDLQTFALYLATMLDPNTSIGRYLNVLIKICGITRRAATQSQVDVTLVSSRPLTLPADFTVQDELGQNWITQDEVSINAGLNTVTLFAENFGVVEALPDTVNNIITIVLGVDSVTNENAALVGRDEETDEELRVRRNQSLENPAYSTTGSLFAKLADLSGVTDLKVYENDTKIDDYIQGVPANSLWVIIEGGSVEDIVETIVKNKTGGTGLKGSIEQVYNETVIKPNGSDFILPHAIKFDRPTYVDLHVRLTVKRKTATTPIDLDLIKKGLSNQSFGIGDTITASELYCTVYSSASGFTAYDLEISTDGATWTDEALEPQLNEKYVISVDNVDITEVIS